MASVAVIVPGAGAGKRFGGKSSKILQRIGGGQPVFLRTLEAFTSRDDVCQVQLVVSQADSDEVKQRFGSNLGFMGVKLVIGGATRTDSVRNALAGVAEEAELICVHDAVRPCVAQPWIDSVFAEAARGGAAILACPVHGTLKKISADRVIEETVSRSDLWVAQTPQVFRRDVLLAAYESDRSATDDAAMVEAIGHPVRVVMGDPRNVKITTPGDLGFAAAVIRTLPKPKEKHRLHPFEEPQW
jgi:2-C-methyl-D-erythritol 4-phosphate cytidylyltransferase